MIRIILPVRRLILCLMVLLLPLRALAGDAMTLQMAIAGGAGQAEAAMPPDCPMHAGGSAAHQAADGADGALLGLSCNACDLCLPLARPALAQADTAPQARHVMRPAPAVVALLVAPRVSVKPPIS